MRTKIAVVSFVYAVDAACLILFMGVLHWI